MRLYLGAEPEEELDDEWAGLVVGADILCQDGAQGRSLITVNDEVRISASGQKEAHQLHPVRHVVGDRHVQRAADDRRAGVDVRS